MTYFDVAVCLATNSAFAPVGNPAPPIPRRPDRCSRSIPLARISTPSATHFLTVLKCSSFEEYGSTLNRVTVFAGSPPTGRRASSRSVRRPQADDGTRISERLRQPGHRIRRAAVIGVETGTGNENLQRLALR